MVQFKSLLDLLKSFPTEQSCIDHLIQLRWNGNVVSPFNPESKVYSCKNNKYKCRSTGKYFNVLTGTIFEGTKISLQNWFIGIYLFSSHKRGLSSYQLAKDLDISQKSAWFMLGRLRFAFEHPEFLQKLSGCVQLDETFVGGKNKNRHRDKKVIYKEDREFSDKVAVWGAISEDGIVRTVAVPNTRKVTILPLVYETVREESIVVTDEWRGYNGISEKYWHEYVDHGKKQYLNDSGFTTNRIENYWSVFKRTINGTYIKASRKHMQRYCNEISFRFNTKDLTANERMNMVLKNTNGRLKYLELTQQNKLKFKY